MMCVGCGTWGVRFYKSGDACGEEVRGGGGGRRSEVRWVGHMGLHVRGLRGKG